MDREVRFLYTTIDNAPQISTIWVDNNRDSVCDEGERTVTYIYTELRDITGADDEMNVPLPLLKTATDVMGRKYSYDYGDILLLKGDLNFKIPASKLDSNGNLTDGVNVEDAITLGSSYLIDHADIEGLKGTTTCFWTFPLNKCGRLGIKKYRNNLFKENLRIFESN